MPGYGAILAIHTLGATFGKGLCRFNPSGLCLFSYSSLSIICLITGGGGVAFINKFGNWNYQSFAPVLVFANSLNGRSDLIAEGRGFDVDRNRESLTLCVLTSV